MLITVRYNKHETTVKIEPIKLTRKLQKNV